MAATGRWKPNACGALADLLIQLGRNADGQEKRRRSADILLDLGWHTAAERQAIAVRLDPPVPAGFWTNI